MEENNQDTSDLTENTNKRVIRGRNLTEDSSVWSANSWDNVAWDDERESAAVSVISSQLAASPHLDSPDAVSTLVQGPAAEQWHRFYTQHNRWFFKDRHWLPSEFPELFDERAKVILEVGCGVGNTIFPLLKARKDEEGLVIHGCDFATSAVQLVKEHRDYNKEKMHIFHHDLAVDEAFEDIPDGSVDVVVSIFVLSALDPERLPFALTKIQRVLKPGGILLFRDYGQYDMTQLRFKANRLIRPNLYIRGDGTAVHYFSEDEIKTLTRDSGFATVKCESDRRLLVNRFRKLQMYRIWIQGKFTKDL